MIGECNVGLSHFQLCSKKKNYGPTLRFTFTWSINLTNGKVLAQSTPGFMAVKNKAGECLVRPPIRFKSVGASYSSCLITADMVNLIRDKLAEKGWWEKIGTNNPIGVLATLEPDLSSKLPANVKHY